MRTHPVFLRLEGRHCVIVGGDVAAAGKAITCQRAGAVVTVVAPELMPELAAAAAAGHLRHVDRTYQAGDLAGALLCYASTRDSDLIRRLRAEAERERVLLNVIDTPDASGFIAPAVVERSELQIAVGTGGASPGLAARLRCELEAWLGPEYGPFVSILGAVRRALAADPARRTGVLGQLLASPLLELVRQRRRDEIDALLARIAGDGFTLEGLGVALEERS